MADSPAEQRKTGLEATRPLAELLRDGRGLVADLSGAPMRPSSRQPSSVIATACARPAPPHPPRRILMLVPPDGYVAWTGERDGLGQALTSWFGQAAPAK
ncbi:aromatic-ring hydroxylase C-terminal domain-containing protein [Nonomuraea sp. 3N208]|uniref:aromatic-ring hydroxylase C-terminal domain-containing protein n=1 Tax=Nonomuraea sp. 3N208 TaxID=3457421 RepID=UPI003FD1FDBD